MLIELLAETLGINEGAKLCARLGVMLLEAQAEADSLTLALTLAVRAVLEA